MAPGFDLPVMTDIFRSMPPEVQAITPAGVPPPGVIPNLSNPPTIGYNSVAAATALMAIMLLIATLRFYSALYVRRKVHADDWTTLAAICMGSCYYSFLVAGVVRAKFGTHLYDVSITHLGSDDFIIPAFFINTFSNLVWPCAKSSFFLMYYQLFHILTWVRCCVYIGLTITWGFYVSTFICQVYFTAPSPGQSWRMSFGTLKYYKAFDMTLPVASCSLALDLFIFIIPMIAVSSLRLSLKKKLGVPAMFAFGLIACIASSLTIHFMNLIRIHRTDHLYYIPFVGLMVTVEMCVGISVSCMPLLARLHTAKKEKLRSNFSFAGKGIKNFFSILKSKKVLEKTNAGAEDGIYAEIEDIRNNAERELKTPALVTGNPARGIEHDPAQLDVHITRATMSFNSQTSIV